jgi:protocatechuate 3,4-dioxygenase alpha subunit
MKREVTPSQTIGPFFHRSLLRDDLSDLTSRCPSGERITIEGEILDGDGAPVSDAMVEIWQANAAGRYNHPADTQDKPLDPAFDGFGRTATDAHGRFVFRTIKPGPVRDAGDFVNAPHINLTIFARGLLHHLVTRIYFPNEPLNQSDPVLSSVPAARRETLIAARTAENASTYRVNIALQGERETVFFDI